MQEGTFLEAPIRRSILLGSLLFAACGPSVANRHIGSETRPGQIVIDEDAIERSGAHNAWEVIKRAAPQLSTAETRSGLPTRLTRRGRSSIVLNDAPLLFIDGIRTVDFRALEYIPAKSIFRIDILNGIEGTTYYGTNAVGGVILVQTKNGSET
jgi:outer membrane cobalamin receptor